MSRAWENLQPSLSEWLLDAVSTLGYEQMTPVQASTIPLFTGNKDVVVEAVTGSGKTLAFLIPVIERLCRLEERTKKHHVAAIILAPTRELASQIHSVLETLLRFHPWNTQESSLAKEVENDAKQPEKDPGNVEIPIRTQLLLGGTTSTAQDLQFFLKESPNLLVSTPGRLAELLSSSHVHCPQSSFEVLVMDEADRLLDLGFKDDLQRIMARLPKQRRTGVFSASVSEAATELIRVGLRNPVRVSVKVKSSSTDVEQRTPASLSLRYIIVPPRKRLHTIPKIIASVKPLPQKIIVYVSTCAAVDYFQHILPILLPEAEEDNVALIPLHGKHPQKVRQKNFNRFVNSVRPTVLLTTDVAARGLDIPQVDLVIQLDPPSDPKVFLHRCGRAGRAGRNGLSIVMLQPGCEEDYVRYMGVRKTPIEDYGADSCNVSDENMFEVEAAVRQTVLADRAIHDKGQRAFVSWVQSYRKHHASSIFRLAELDWEALGRGWGLIRLPKMPERKASKGDRWLGSEVDMRAYAYSDKAREKARLAQDADGHFTGSKEGKFRKHKESTQSWAQQLERKEKKGENRESRKKKREALRIEKMSDGEKKREAEVLDLVEEVKRRKLLQSDEWNGFED